MREHTWQDKTLDALLALLVITSLILSLQVWYPPTELFSLLASADPSVQPQPPVSEREMPEIFRPDMLLLRKDGDTLAPVHTGSVSYKQTWPKIRGVLTGLRVSAGAFQVEQVPERLKEGAWVQLQLPSALMLSQWADLWLWNTPVLRSGSTRIDRVNIYLDEPGAIYLSGPTGITLYLADLPANHRTLLADLVASVEPGAFLPYRALNTNEMYARIHSDLRVPVMTKMPKAQVRIAFPEQQHEEVRYFPDLSVVRQIDERDARSLTDGQRLLRVTSAGILEYRTADPSNTTNAPDMQRAITLAQEWVGSRGGWPQELVLRDFIQQPGRAKLEFDFRSGGQFPVESVGSAVQVHMSAQRILYFAKHPMFVETRFSAEQIPLISPEAAIAQAIDEATVMLTEPVRSMHLAYMVKPNPLDVLSGWEMEPAWVIQAGNARIYVPAAAGQPRTLPLTIR